MEKEKLMKSKTEKKKIKEKLMKSKHHLIEN